MVKRIIKIVLRIVGVYIYLMIMGGCTHKRLCRPEECASLVRVAFDWSKSPEANPRLMTVLFYPEDDEDPIRFDFTNMKGGVVHLMPGKYKVVCYNNSSDVLQTRNEKSFSTIESFTRTTAPLTGALSYLKAPVRVMEMEYHLPVDALWTDCLEMVSIESVVDNSEQVVTLHPDASFVEISFSIHGINNGEHISAASASLNGLSSSYFVGKRALSDTNVAIPMAVQKVKKGGDIVLEGCENSYGISPLPNIKHNFMLFVILDDGTKYYYSFDVTDQINAQKGNHKIRLEIKDLSVPKPITNGNNGFPVSIEDWQSVVVHIKM